MAAPYTDYVVRCEYKSHSIHETSVLEVIRTDDVAEARCVAEAQAWILGSVYSCQVRQWGRDTWRVWEPGEDGFNMWVRLSEAT